MSTYYLKYKYTIVFFKLSKFMNQNTSQQHGRLEAVLRSLSVNLGVSLEGTVRHV